ncbi:MAG: hypothetical protein KU38_09220 [Sulfurovum sp. FS08-3]|nr:MAG: hypothetical protein KU38_09220 [Sulfurovum sp. FS08-3]
MNDYAIKTLVGELHTFLIDTKELENIPQKNDLINLSEKLSEKIDNAVSKNGVLRIGVVGQVKAGKSSFINALLFDGKDILPKASTPMTAALTVIKYAETLSAQVEFYSKADWGIVERNAQEFERMIFEVAKQKQSQIDEHNKKLINALNKQDNILQQNTKLEELLAKQEIFDEAKRLVGDAVFGAYELLRMAKKEHIDYGNLIGTTQKIENIASIPDLIGKLNEYVGANGKYTPITRNTTLSLNIPTLKDIELVDTPGVNDPIISRGMATRDFLSRCDTVFLLSTSSQFMGQEDTEFLVNTLPADGITNIILLGSKFDSVLVDEFKKYGGDIKKAIKDIYQKLSQQANNALQAVINSNPNKPIMEKVKNKEVKFISGICYNIAKKGRENLDEMEKHALENLEKRYNITLDDKVLFELANIDRIKNIDLEKIKSQKDEILANKLSDLIAGQSNEFNIQLESLLKVLNAKMAELDRANVKELQQRAAYIENGLNRAGSDVKQVFTDLSFDIEENIYKLIRLINDRSSDYLGIKVESKSKEESYEVCTGSRSTSSWWNPFSWGSSKKVYETHYRTINYNVANVVDAAENASMFVRLINEEVAEIWGKIVDIQVAESALIKSALKGFDLEDENFDKDFIINPVKNALRAIKVKPLQMKDKAYRDAIANYFSSSEIQDDNIDKLKNKVREIIYQICEDIEAELEKTLADIKKVLEEKGDGFIHSIKEHSQKEISTILKDLEIIDDAKKRYQKTIADVKNFKNQFEEVK